MGLRSACTGSGGKETLIMSPRSKISRLPREIQNRIGELYDSGHTIDEIMASLASIGASRSALGRYVQQRDRLAERVRRSRAVSDSIVQNLGGAAPGKQQALLIELLHSALLEMFLDDDGQIKNGGETLKGNLKGMKMLSDALRSLAQANQLDVETRAKLEEKLRQRIEQETRTAVRTQARKQGLSAETVRQIMAGAFGVQT